MRYEQDHRKMKAEATFFELSTTDGNMQIRMESSVAFIGSNMVFNEKLTRYQFERTIDLPKNLSFSWNGDDGTKTIFEMEPINIGNFKLGPTEKDYLLNIDAPPLEKNEKLTLLFNSKVNGKTNLEFVGPTDELGVNVTSNAIAKFISSTASMSIVRTKTYYAEQENCTCTITQSYYSDWKEIAF